MTARVTGQTHLSALLKMAVGGKGLRIASPTSNVPIFKRRRDMSATEISSFVCEDGENVQSYAIVDHAR